MLAPSHSIPFPKFNPLLLSNCAIYSGSILAALVERAGEPGHDILSIHDLDHGLGPRLDRIFRDS